METVQIPGRVGWRQSEPQATISGPGVCAVERCRFLAGLVGRQSEPQATIPGQELAPQKFRASETSKRDRKVAPRRFPG